MKQMMNVWNVNKRMQKGKEDTSSHWLIATLKMT